MSGREIKKKIFDFLRQDDNTAGIKNICALPEKQAVNPLFSFFLNADPLIKWRAVTAMGAVVSQLADKKLEDARVIIRRLMWTLNDESGGIGWGSPEAMGEILARHDTLAREYHTILISYIDPKGNYLEHDLLQRGVLWGIGRFAHARPEDVEKALPNLTPLLDSDDPYIRGLSGWTCGIYYQNGDDQKFDHLSNDKTIIDFYNHGVLNQVAVSNLAKQTV